MREKGFKGAWTWRELRVLSGRGEEEMPLMDLRGSREIEVSAIFSKKRKNGVAGFNLKFPLGLDMI